MDAKKYREWYKSEWKKCSVVIYVHLYINSTLSLNFWYAIITSFHLQLLHITTIYSVLSLTFYQNLYEENLQLKHQLKGLATTAKKNEGLAGEYYEELVQKDAQCQELGRC